MNELKCDFDGENINFSSNPQSTLRLRRYSSATHPAVFTKVDGGELIWDKATRTLFHKNRDGSVWRANFSLFMRAEDNEV